MVALVISEMGKPEGDNRILSSKTFASCISSVWGNRKCLRQILESEVIGFAMQTMDGSLLRTNTALCQMLNYSEVELKRTGLDSLIHPDDKDRAQDIVLWTEADKISYSEYEKRYRCGDGSYLWVRSGTEIFCSDNGAPMYYVSQIENISKQKQAELSLLQKELEYRSLADNSPDVISRFDLEGRRIFVNKQFEKQYRRLSTELLGLRPDEESFTDAVFGKQLSLKIAQVLKDKKSTDFEISYPDCSSIIRYDLVRLVPEFDLEGKLKGVLAIITDISRQKQAEEALFQKELEYRLIIENSSDVIVRYDKTGRCIYANQVWETITGYLQFDILDKTPVQNTFLPDEAAQRMEAILHQVIQSGLGVKQEFILLHAVTRLPVYLMVDVIPEVGIDGIVNGLIVVARDISSFKGYENELKMKQDFLERTQQLGHIGSWDLDLRTNTREWSKGTYLIFELNPDRVMPSNDIFMGLVHPDDRERIAEIYNELGKDRFSYTVEFRLLFPDGRMKYVKELGITQFDSNEKLVRYVGYVQDITEAKVLENKLIVALDKADEASKIKSSFLASLSHEIRTPMNAILGFSSLLKDDMLSIEERNEFIDYVDNSITSLTGLIDNVIEMSKIVTGDILVKLGSYSPEDIVMQQFEELEELCRKAGKEKLSLKAEIANDLDGNIFVSDTSRIKQTIRILTDNAVKFTSSGEIVLGVKLTGSGLVVFYISDTGIGIPPEKQKVIFDPFVQVEGSLSRQFGGLGIGLSVARLIARALGGDVTLVSEQGKGSVFSFDVPRECDPRVR